MYFCYNKKAWMTSVLWLKAFGSLIGLEKRKVMLLVDNVDWHNK